MSATWLSSSPSEDFPAYVRLLANGDLRERARQATAQLSACALCGWECRKDRTVGKLGVCRTGSQARVSSYGPHHFEEHPLSGWAGSGTIFFSRCNLRCVYCQNAEISQSDAGEELSAIELAKIMLHLQELGCHNINLVSPTHVLPQILEALVVAAEAGLRLPLVYNTGGYDAVDALRLLDGIIDIYMPDMKYSQAAIGKQLSGIRDYPQVNRAAVREMHRQVGDLMIDQRGLARRGLLVRHLVLPGGLAGTAEVMRFLSEGISRNTYLNLMDQYRPAYQAERFPQLNRRITLAEYAAAREQAKKAGLHRLD